MEQEYVPDAGMHVANSFSLNSYTSPTPYLGQLLMVGGEAFAAGKLIGSGRTLGQALYSGGAYVGSSTAPLGAMYTSAGQRLGATFYAGDVITMGATRVSMAATDLWYGTGSLQKWYFRLSAVGGIGSGLNGGIPGLPPSYIPSGIDDNPVYAPFFVFEGATQFIMDGVQENK